VFLDAVGDVTYSQENIPLCRAKMFLNRQLICKGMLKQEGPTVLTTERIELIIKMKQPSLCMRLYAMHSTTLI